MGERLRQVRKQRGLTQQALGGLIGAAASWISDLEKGKQRGLAAESVLRLAQALDCTADYLLGLADQPARPARRRRKPSSADADKEEAA